VRIVTSRYPDDSLSVFSLFSFLLWVSQCDNCSKQVTYVVCIVCKLYIFQSGLHTRFHVHPLPQAQSFLSVATRDIPHRRCNLPFRSFMVASVSIALPSFFNVCSLGMCVNSVDDQSKELLGMEEGHPLIATEVGDNIVESLWIH
jgi:hypothetical protein